MKNTLRRLLSALLVLSMVVSLVPAVFATEVTEGEEPAAQVVTDEVEMISTEESSDEPAQDSIEATEGDTEAAEETTEVSEEATEATEETTEVTEEVTEATEATEEATEPSEDVVEDVITDEAVDASLTGANMTAAGMVTVSQTTNDLAPGVSYTKIITRNASNQQNIGFLTEVDLSQNVALKAAYNGYYTENSVAAGRAEAAKSLAWGFSTTTGLAADYESIADAAGTVIMATNGDYFNMGTGEPLGYLIMEGNAIKTKGEPYFAILKDGTAVIRDAGTDHSDVQEAISGPFYLIKDGAIVVAKDADQMPRNSVGIREDGSVVFYLNDGRQAPSSVGMTLYEVASVLLDAGCVDALYLDGGGSATLAARPEGSDFLKIVSSPSDGQEREVSSAMLIVSTAEATGVFDHAAISPKNELYTPGSAVQFTAAGVDTAGASVEIPSDVQWALAEDSKDMGTIDANGLFTAGDKTGAVTVIMTQNGKNVGSTTIEIVIPDQIYFTNEEISLGFEDSTDFGLAVRYQNRDVNIKVGDIVWTTTNDKMGTFEGNIFTASDGESLNGDITATSAHDEEVSGTIHVIVGMLPTIVWDFEDVVNEDGSITPAEEYYTNLLTHANYGRGGTESIEIVSIDDDEPVRFGEKSLKLNYDFTQCGAVTEGAIVGTSESFAIPGTPTAIGVWVYAPEGVGIEWGGDGTQAGFWLRGYVNNGSTPVDYTFEPKHEKVQSGEVQPGIYWEGWMYLEADLTNIQAPYSLYKGNTFRLMYVAGTMMGTKTANSIYFDNLQFVYGTNVDDVDSPVVNSISIGTNELENGEELTTDTITLRTTFSDVQNKYTSGIDANTVRMFIDGVNVVDNDKYQFALNANDGYAELYNLKLTDGTHSITVSMRDNFGNDVEETRYFTVKSGVAAPTTVTAAPVEKIASLGGVVTLEVRASDATVKTSDTIVRLSNMFPDFEVMFSDNYTGTYKYAKSANTVTINAERKADAAAEDDDLIAKIVVKVPSTLTENESFLYEIESGSFTTASDYYATYSVPETTLPVGAGIALSNDPILVGGPKGVIKVTDLEGKGVAGAGIYLVSDNTLIGTTDENGHWETDYFSASAGKVAVYAKTEDGLLSFHYNVETYNAVGDSAEIPTQVLFNAPVDNATQKSITWISNPLTNGAQSIRYRVKDDSADKQWTLVDADTELLTFTSDNKAANINSVILNKLTPGTTYEYQVGTSGTWTEIATFTTSDAGSETKFFVMSDIQAADLTNVYNMMDKISEGGYEFGIQTGDAIDSVTSFSQVYETADLLGAGQLDGIDMIRVLGNHEYYGDAEAVVASSLYNISDPKAGSGFSVTYGDVYVAVINFTNTNAELAAAMEWLLKDAQASDATWKVLAMHQPPYYTNASGGNAPVYTYVPDVAEEAGIDVVFSGHDHALARTNQLTDDQIDTENGILYYIGGSSGEKSYSISSQEIFDYETIFALATTDFNATYIGVSADKHKMTLDIYDLAADGTQKIVDTYTLMTETGACAAAGHELENAVHADGKLTCNKCGEAVDPAEVKYTGWAVDKATGLKMLFIAGVAETGESLYGDNTYYFDENGVAYDGKVTIDEVELEFDNGLLIGGYTGFIKKTNEKTYHYVDGKMTYGWYEEDGNWYHFNTETGVMNTETHVIPDDEAKSKNAYYDFGEDGKLLQAYFNPAGYYYWAGLPLGDAWVKNGADPDPDAWYRTNGDGHFMKDKTDNATVLIAVDGVEYTIDNTNGKLLKGSIVNEKGVLYYYWAGEPVNDGWFELDGETYYAFESGHLATGSWTIDGEAYMFNADGKLVTEGMILTGTLSEKSEQMTIKLANADKELTAVRVAVWPISDTEKTMWLDAEKDGEGLWTVTAPMCQFGLNNADTFAIHAYGTVETESFLVDTTVQVPVAVAHIYTDDEDTTCNICGEIREIEPEEVETVPMFRLYNPNSGEHFYTGSEEEWDGLVELGWQYEGVAWNSPVKGGVPVHRVYNPNSGDHHYTTDVAEVQMLVELGWQYEGVAWNSASEDNIPQYRMWNPNADLGSHHYTSSEEERDSLVAEGWIFEGIGWYGTLK